MPHKQQGGHCNGRLTNSQLLTSMSISALGDVHPARACALCGLLDSETELEPTLLKWTMAEAMVCTDLIGCMRRRRGMA
jgi:hypothetical protein